MTRKTPFTASTLLLALLGGLSTAHTQEACSSILGLRYLSRGPKHDA